jgi:ribosomal protein S18 acetylase RimI-like enzyme
LVGSVTLTRQKDPYWIPERGPSLYLHRLIVSRQHKGKEIGEFILKWSLTFACRKGFSYLRLDCRESNPVLKEYYKKQGFSDLGNARGLFVYRLFEQETSDQFGRISSNK